MVVRCFNNQASGASQYHRRPNVVGPMAQVTQPCFAGSSSIWQQHCETVPVIAAIASTAPPVCHWNIGEPMSSEAAGTCRMLLSRVL
jgi:hypothetical protein